MRRIAALLSAIWLGMHIGFGYIVAPIIFTRLQNLPDGKMMAGNIAGSLFHIVNWVGLLAWLLIFLIAKDSNRQTYQRTRLPFWTGLLLGLLAINEWLITPVIEAIKTNQTNWLHNLIGGRMGLWHGMSSIIHLIIAVIGLCFCFVLWRLNKFRRKFWGGKKPPPTLFFKPLPLLLFRLHHHCEHYE